MRGPIVSSPSDTPMEAPDAMVTTFALSPVAWLRGRAESYSRDARAFGEMDAEHGNGADMMVTAGAAYQTISTELRNLADEFAIDTEPTRTCHLCGKVKTATSDVRADYLLAFHYDRRHRGWTA